VVPDQEGRSNFEEPRRRLLLQRTCGKKQYASASGVSCAGGNLALAAFSYMRLCARLVDSLPNVADTWTFSKHRRDGTAVAHVLVAEDNPDVADTLAALLEIDGHEVHVVDDGVAALTEADRRLPDAVVLDIGLPSLNGIQVARRLRQQYGDTLRLIAYTAYDDDGMQRKIRQVGFDVLLTKPAPAGELLDAVARANVRRRRGPDRRERARSCIESRRPRHSTR
jgi:CheY-like chemotaxis protein